MASYKDLRRKIELGMDYYDTGGDNTDYFVRKMRHEIRTSGLSDDSIEKLENFLDTQARIWTEVGNKQREEKKKAAEERYKQELEQEAIEKEKQHKEHQIERYKQAWNRRNPIWRVLHRKLNPKRVDLESMTSEEIKTSEEMSRVRK